MLVFRQINVFLPSLSFGEREITSIRKIRTCLAEYPSLLRSVRTPTRPPSSRLEARHLPGRPLVDSLRTSSSRRTHLLVDCRPSRPRSSSGLYIVPETSVGLVPTFNSLNSRKVSVSERDILKDI